MGQKPELKISAKNKDDGEEFVSLFAFWRRDNGKLSGSLDGRIKGMRVYLADGGHVDIKRRDDGKDTHWINCFEERTDPPPQSRSQERRQATQRDDDFPPDDFGDDDIPF